MKAKIDNQRFACYDEAGEFVGEEIRQSCEGSDDLVVLSITDEHFGAHTQALHRGLTRVPIEIPQTIPPASGQKH